MSANLTPGPLDPHPPSRRPRRPRPVDRWTATSLGLIVAAAGIPVVAGAVLLSVAWRKPQTAAPSTTLEERAALATNTRPGTVIRRTPAEPPAPDRPAPRSSTVDLKTTPPTPPTPSTRPVPPTTRQTAEPGGAIPAPRPALDAPALDAQGSTPAASTTLPPLSPFAQRPASPSKDQPSLSEPQDRPPPPAPPPALTQAPPPSPTPAPTPVPSPDEARYNVEQLKSENARLRDELAALQDRLTTTNSRVASLAQEMEQRLNQLREVDERLQRAMVTLTQAEQARDREAAARTTAEAAQKQTQAALLSTHEIYAPLAPARIEHRRLSQRGLQLAEKADFPLGPLWDGLGDIFVGVLEAVGGPTGEPVFLAIFGSGGQAIIDAAAAQRWRDLGVPYLEIDPVPAPPVAPVSPTPVPPEPDSAPPEPPAAPTP